MILEQPALSTPGEAAAPAENRGFGARLMFWLAALVSLAFCWAAANSWVEVMAVPLAFVPLQLIVAAAVCRREGICWRNLGAPSEWEMLVSVLLLAVGVANGVLLFISIGWICLGTALLRPAGASVKWDEWFKLPLLFFFTFPVYFDLAGSRWDWLSGFYAQEDGSSLFDWNRYLLFEIFFKTALCGMAWLLRGAAFWLCLPMAAAAFIFHGPLLALFGDPNNTTRSAYVLILASGIVLGGTLATQRLKRHAPLWGRLRDWAAGRTYSIWLAALVILLAQSSLLERWLSGNVSLPEMGAVALLISLLAFARSRYSSGDVHVRSRALLALALFVLLAAEWVDFDPGRRLSLSLLVISLLSWRKEWSVSLYLGALIACLALITPASLSPFPKPLPHEGAARLGAFFFGIAIALPYALHGHRRLHPGVADAFWQPAKRLAFILLALLVSFQTLSEIAAEENAERVELSDLAELFGNGPFVARIPAFAASLTETKDWGHKKVVVFAARPTARPAGLLAPERIALARGWKVAQREYLAHPRGRCMALLLERGDERAAAVYWFDHGARAFASFQRARRVLWSGWNLARRDLRLVFLQSAEIQDPAKLLSFAKQEGGFSFPAR